MSDQADKVAIEVFYKVKGAVFMGGLPTYNELPPYVRGEVDAIASLIRSHTDSRELVEAVKAMILLVEDYEAKTCKVVRAAITIGKDDWRAEAKERELTMHRMFEFLDTLRSALSSHEPRVCEWVYSDDFDTCVWEASCGASFWYPDDGPIENRQNFCQNCGKRLKVKENL